MANKVIEAREALKGIRSGMNDQALMEKFQLSPRGLQSLFDRLLASGLIKQEEIVHRVPLGERTVSLAIYRCPACDMPQLAPFDECPQCGIIVSKYRKGAANGENVSGRQQYHDQPSGSLASPVSDADPENNGNQETKAAPQLRGVLWKFRTDGLGVSAPAISGGVICFGGSDCILRCVMVESRVEKWRLKTDGPINAAPVIAEGHVYFGTLSGTFHAVDLRTGKVKWQFIASAPIYASAVVHGGFVYFGDYEGNLYALASDSGEQWARFTLGQAIRSRPVISGGKIYVGCNDGHLYVID